MNTIRLKFNILLCAAALSFGCSTTADTSTPEQSAARRAADTKAVVQAGVSLAINHDPSLRDSFVKASAVLSIVITAGATDPNAILAAIHQVVPENKQNGVDEKLRPILKEFASQLPAVAAGLSAALEATASKSPQ